MKTNSINCGIIPLIDENNATDYSKDDNWMYKQTDGGHEVDLLYFYPTVTQYPNDLVLSRINREMKESATYAFAETASCFAPCTNVFAPFYTQLPIHVSKEQIFAYFTKYKINPSVLAGGYLEMIAYTHVRTDIYAALDYYFVHLNNGRPFILAGHSQGSAVCQIILREYMKVHPEYFSRMVVTYSGGFAITKDYLNKYPHLKYAEGETDTGVIVSWTTEAPGGTSYSAVTPKNSICINPLNWKRDATPASAQLNKGMLSPVHWLHCWEIIHDNLADATIDPNRGVVVTHMDINKYPLETNIPVAGDKSFHTFDYAFFYMNLRENVKKRIEAYLGKSIKE
ncbi:MAG: DUF3089 domain-containing protein [Bacilli bacterium]|nr:DUF3089 domain-containing protein [Bacilli bacterium]